MKRLIYQTHFIGFSFRYVFNDKQIERFWNFLTTSQHYFQTLAACILDELSRLEVNERPHKFIAQTYDRASVMAGCS